MQDSSPNKSIVIPIIIAVMGVASMTLAAFWLNNGTLPLWIISKHRIVNLTFTTQFMILPLSFVAIGVMYFYDRQNFRSFFRFSFSSPGGENGWNLFGPIVLIGVTLGNAMLMSFAVISEHGTINNVFLEMFPLILLVAATNAWSEEIFSRFVIVAGLNNKMTSDMICMISAIIFGLPHFLGTPSGIFGVIVSGGLGWLLAKSVIETKSLGWALLIHFVQDIVIFGAGGMIIAGSAER